MSARDKFRRAAKWTAGAAGFAAGAYAAYVAAAWLGYGRPARPRDEEVDALLDRFMPAYEVAERYHIHVAAPADITFAAACKMDLMRSPIIRAIFRTRELVLGSQPESSNARGGVLEFTKSIGWNVLAEIPAARS